MTYLISDIAGRLDLLTRMLQKIDFSEEDLLYVLGDSVGDGDASIGVLSDLSMRANVYPIAGEKDYRAFRMLGAFESLRKSGETPDPELLREMTDWTVYENGKVILDEFRALDEDMREGILDYLSEMTLFEETGSGNSVYLLLHAGISGFEKGKDLEEYPPERFFAESFPEEYPTDAIVVTGHEPTGTGRIEKNAKRIRIPCGEQLACLCLETGKEFYV